MKSRVVAILFVLSVCGFCLADTIVLKQGQTLTGDILAEKETVIYVDIGVTVLPIPKDEILEYKYSTNLDIEDTDANKPYVEIGKSQQPAGQLYRVGNLKKTTIEKCVDAYSEAVVKISTPAGTGSGFFVNEQGYLITNYHVIERETKVEVTMFQKAKDGFEKKKFKKVKIEAINPFVDLALLKVEDLGDAKVTFAYLGDIDSIKVGEKVFAIGNPLGLERTVTDGVISSINRAFEGLVYIQTNADIKIGRAHV